MVKGNVLVLVTLLALIGPLFIACGESGPGSITTESRTSQDEAGGDEKISLTFATFSTGPDTDVFQRIIDRYQAANPNVTIEMNILPTQGYAAQIDTQLAAGQGPDIVRAGFRGDFGRYAATGAAVDLTPYLEEGYADQFLPAAWQIVSIEGKIVGLPLVTDTHAVFFNTDYFKQLGITVPKTLDECWTWDEFIEIARRVKDETDADYAFAVPLQGSNSKRWLPFLYMHGGQVLSDDLKMPQIDSPAGVEAIAWTQSWFIEGLVPPSTSLKSNEQIQHLFANGTIGMMIHGNYMMPYLDENMQQFGWDVTYMPCDAEKASDLGGNGLVVTKDSKHPEIAADFLKFMVNEENMAELVTANLFIPVRKALMEKQLTYPKHDEKMQLFETQATTIPSDMAAVMAHPQFSEIDRILADQLELAFTAGQAPDATAQNIAQQLQQILSR